MFELTKREEKIFRKLNTPQKIQDFLETIPVNFEPNGDTCMSPRRVLVTRRAHCMEGALFAATVLWYHGARPLLLDLRSTKQDFDHVVALFHQRGRWGAISKTNHAVLRWREPVYKTVRELAVSYFHEYFLDDGRKTLRDFSKPFDVRQFGKKWVTADKDLWEISTALDESPHEIIADRRAVKTFRRADKIEIAAGKLVQWKKR